MQYAIVLFRSIYPGHGTYGRTAAERCKPTEPGATRVALNRCSGAAAIAHTPTPLRAKSSSDFHQTNLVGGPKTGLLAECLMRALGSFVQPCIPARGLMHVRKCRKILTRTPRKGTI